MRHYIEIDNHLFFVHWSWKIPDEVLKKYICIGFHMTDLPYGRGGSPLQNLIMRGHKKTKISAFRITDEMDAGDIYLKRTLSLKGTAEEIYKRAYEIIYGMIPLVLKRNPRPQKGKVTYFKRRTPRESRIKRGMNIYDFIRMLNADGYPKAFIESAGFRFEFTDYKRGVCKCKITLKTVR